MVGSENTVVRFRGDGHTNVFEYPYDFAESNSLKCLYCNEEGELSNVTASVTIDGRKVKYPREGAMLEGGLLIVYRETPVTQTVDLPNSYPYDILEKALDRITYILQEHAREIGKSLRLSPNSIHDDFILSDDNVDFIQDYKKYRHWIEQQLAETKIEREKAEGARDEAEQHRDMVIKAITVTEENVKSTNEDVRKVRDMLANATRQAGFNIDDYQLKEDARIMARDLKSEVANAMNTVNISTSTMIQQVEQSLEAVQLEANEVRSQFETFKALPVDAATLGGLQYQDIANKVLMTNAPVMTPLLDWERMASENGNVDVRTVCSYDSSKYLNISYSRKHWLKEPVGNFDYLFVTGSWGNRYDTCASKLIPTYLFTFMMHNFAKYICIDFVDNIYFSLRPYESEIAPSWETGNRSTEEYWMIGYANCALLEVYGIKIPRN